MLLLMFLLLSGYNKFDTLTSNFAGEQPIQESRWLDNRSKSLVTIPCLNLVKEYNKNMGGVDFLDSLIRRYKIRTRNKKWYRRIFYHLIGFPLVNSWILYCKHKKDENEKHLTWAEYRLEQAECLCKIGNQQPVNRGRQSTSLEKQIEEKKWSNIPCATSRCSNWWNKSLGYIQRHTHGRNQCVKN